MTLIEAQIGKEYRIEKLMINQPLKQRLEAMGLIEGTVVRKINEALDGSIIFMVRGTRLAVGKDLAMQIGVFSEMVETKVNPKESRMRGHHENE